MRKKEDETECCANCKHLISEEKGNRYGDMVHFCLVTGYFALQIHKDRNRYKSFTPGGKPLPCRYERKMDE